MPQKYSKSLYREVRHFGNVTVLKEEVEIKVVKTANQVVRKHQDGAKDFPMQVKCQMFHGSIETSSEEESDESDDNSMDAAAGKTSLNVKEYLAMSRDEVDNVCLARHLNVSRRSRQMSLSESEDSFIVFDKGSEDEDCNFSEDSTDGQGKYQKVEDLSEDVLNTEILGIETVRDEAACSRPNMSVKSAKKVHFADDGQLCNVHSMVKWAYAYQAARKGPWEEYARDRDRFKRRISEVSRVLDTVLQATHRRHIFNDRFVSFEVPLKI